MTERFGYKVVTSEMQSLGLRRNPNILTYPQGQWYKLPEDWIVAGNSGWGGIWVAKQKSGATTLQKYMSEKYGISVRVFIADIATILFENSYRIKTDAIFLREEI